MWVTYKKKMASSPSVNAKYRSDSRPANLQTKYVAVCCLVGGTDEYGAIVEWKLEGENRRDFDETLFQRHLVHDKSTHTHMKRTRTEIENLRRKGNVGLSEP